jgi:hypothetical protein
LKSAHARWMWSIHEGEQAVAKVMTQSLLTTQLIHRATGDRHGRQ